MLHESHFREHNLSLTEEELRAELRVAKKEAKRKVQSVRAFWKDKIYGEQARAGIIV